MRKLLVLVSLSLSLAACGSKAKPAAPAAPAEPSADPELVCCTVASAGETMSSMVPAADCPDENKTPDACGNE